jgi:hypothetical protein
MHNKLVRRTPAANRTSLDQLKEHVSVDGKFLPAGNTVHPILTVGSVWSGNNIPLYRQEGAMLTSVDNFWSGHVGGQTFPWVAVAGDVPVWTQSGLVKTNWLDKEGPKPTRICPMSSKRAMWP